MYINRIRNKIINLYIYKLPWILAIWATTAGPNERVGLIEHPSIGIKKRLAIIMLIDKGNTPKGPAPSLGISIVDSTLNISIIVASISAKNTCPPVNTAGSLKNK